MPLESTKIGCEYKTLFPNPVTIIVRTCTNIIHASYYGAYYNTLQTLKAHSIAVHLTAVYPGANYPPPRVEYAARHDHEVELNFFDSFL